MDPTASFAAWIAALMNPRERPPLAAAVVDAVRIERHGPVPRDAPPPLPPPIEIFDGIDAIAGWLRRLPTGVTFTLVGEPIADGPGWRIEYALEVDGFENGGMWLARLADDGRLLWLSHRPFPVPAKYQQL